MRKSVLDDSSVLHSLFNSTLELLVSPGGTTQYQCRAEGTCNSFPMALREEASLGRGSRSPPPGLLTGLGKSRGCPCGRGGPGPGETVTKNTGTFGLLAA